MLSSMKRILAALVLLPVLLIPTAAHAAPALDPVIPACQTNDPCEPIGTRVAYSPPAYLGVIDTTAMLGATVGLVQETQTNNNYYFYAAQISPGVQQFEYIIRNYAEPNVDGILSGLCLSLPNDTKGVQLVLRDCKNGGNEWQDFETGPTDLADGGVTLVTSQDPNLYLNATGYGALNVPAQGWPYLNTAEEGWTGDSIG